MVQMPRFTQVLTQTLDWKLYAHPIFPQFSIIESFIQPLCIDLRVMPLFGCHLVEYKVEFFPPFPFQIQHFPATQTHDAMVIDDR